MVSPGSQLVSACRGVLALAAHGTPSKRDIYRHVYAGGFDGNPRSRVPSAMSLSDHLFVTAIAFATTDSSFKSIQPARQGNGNSVEADIEGVFVSVDAAQIADDQIGSRIQVSIPRVRAGRDPGWVTRTAFEPLGSAISRIYLNIGPHQARWALHRASKAVEEAGVSVASKVAAHPGAYARCDSGVLYVPATSETIAVEAVRDAATAGAIRLGDRIPLLTKRICSGIGVADDPSDQRERTGIADLSHGEWVSQMLYDAHWGQSDPAAMADAVLGLVQQCGRDPARPHRRPPDG